ncbi:hypothetical protein [Pseudanabaena mucicola]|uniref:SPOR domain-containing protein n=1 Tax=Pseudanabaena mucicola FACHB-723 TaxID=2692860 RepID=A0ABR7ZXL2_9CYAN|nr:hypothetical protein [Pseudanabaena mucicola]MBD2188530.1 hypothetical protein [Pseudanabaena mucicola FACHB-723]
MRTFGWLKQSIPMVIASLGFMNIAIAEVNAQVGNVVVYIAGNNPVTLDVTRQVVTNPIIASVNGRTSIVAGSFDAQTADFVARELQRRGLAAQLGYQNSAMFQPNQPVSNNPYVTLPSYLPTSPAAINNNPSQYRYITGVPVRSGDMTSLARIRQFIPNAFISKSELGDYIYAGGYTNRDAAESLKHFLRSQGVDARVLYF